MFVDNIINKKLIRIRVKLIFAVDAQQMDYF
jgi:hypothetical protein